MSIQINFLYLSEAVKKSKDLKKTMKINKLYVKRTYKYIFK